MATRVLTTDEAKQAIDSIQSILSGGLTDTITQLKGQGNILSDPNVWDGVLAMDFRGTVWPSCASALDNAQLQLQELQTKLNMIHQNIFTAGGNA